MAYTNRIDFGTISGINLLLTRHFEYDGKHYYYLSRSGLNNITNADKVTGSDIDSLFNPGGHTGVTQEGNHDGTDDERSIYAALFTIILPTESELVRLFNSNVFDASNYPTGFFRVADAPVAGSHRVVSPTSPPETAIDSVSSYIILQVIESRSLSLGVHNGINLNLILPSIQNGKHYFYLDHDGSNDVSVTDSLIFQSVRDLLNSGNRINVTQEGNHDGTDDERSVVIGPYTIILPTESELEGLTLEGTEWSEGYYWAADSRSDISQRALHLPDHTAVNTHVLFLSGSRNQMIFQVIGISNASFFDAPTSLEKITLSRVTLLERQTSTVKFIFNEIVTGFSLSNITNTEDTISDFEILEAGKSYKVILTPDAGTDRPSNYLEVSLSGVTNSQGDSDFYTLIHRINYIVDTIPITTVPDIIEPTPAWPDSLPGASSNRYELKPRGSFRRTEMTSGISRHRRISRNPPTEINMSWDMSISEFALFEAFFVYDLNEGEKWFTMESSSSKGCIVGEYRFVKMEEPYTAKAVTSESFQVLAVLELRYKDLLDRSDLAALSNISPDIAHLPIWFDSLPSPLVQAYSIKPKSSVRRTSIESGANQHATTSYDIPTVFTMQWNMTNQQFLQFQSFYQYNLNDGQSWFYMDHAEGIGFVPGEFRFIKTKSPYTAVYLSHDHFTVKATVERRGKKLMYRDTYNIIICDDQDITDLVFDDAYSRLHIYLHHTLPSIQGQW